jgi:hypothetical protein
MAFEALPPRKRWKSHTLTSPFLIGVNVSVKMTIPEFLHSHMDGTVKALNRNYNSLFNELFNQITNVYGDLFEV